MRLHRRVVILFAKLVSLWCAFVAVPFTYFQFFGTDRQSPISYFSQQFDLKSLVNADAKSQWWDGCELRNLSTVGRKAGVPSVVVLTYQRCGSSFYSQILNTNPSAFNLFEPLDSVYSSLYGTSHGYNGPSDIYNYANGTLRRVPDVELETVSGFLTDMFSCEISKFSTDMFYHAFWIQSPEYYSPSLNYTRCLETKVASYKRRMCDKFNPWHCGSRFGEKPEEKLEECRKVLSDQLRWSGSDFEDTNNVTTSGKENNVEKLRKRYGKYRICLANVRKQIDSECAPHLQKVCSNSQLRSTKVVRASMHSMEPLLAADSQFRVIHLIRDPRAVVASRMVFDGSVSGLYSLRASSKSTDSPYETSAVREATLYCRRAVENLRLAARLAALYPGRIMTVRYEDAIKDLESHVEEVYQFIGFDRVPNATLTWARRDMTDKMARKSTPIDKWKKQFSADQSDAIVDVCSTFYSLVDDATQQ